jgi:hypothetical protein
MGSYNLLKITNIENKSLSASFVKKTTRISVFLAKQRVQVRYDELYGDCQKYNSKEFS